MELYRIARKEYIKDLSGEGARLYGGRWNSKGTPVVYTSETRSLAFTEMFVNTSMSILQYLPNVYSLLALHLPNNYKVEDISLNDLPKDWKSYPHIPELAQIGDQWIKANKTLLLRIPSAVVHGEFNVLINPLHKDLKKIKLIVEGFPFDKRLSQFNK